MMFHDVFFRPSHGDGPKTSRKKTSESQGIASPTTWNPQRHRRQHGAPATKDPPSAWDSNQNMGTLFLYFIGKTMFFCHENEIFWVSLFFPEIQLTSVIILILILIIIILILILILILLLIIIIILILILIPNQEGQHLRKKH